MAPPFQRENREDYIAKLERDLASLPVGQAEEKDSDDEWMSSQVRLVPAAAQKGVNWLRHRCLCRPLGAVTFMWRLFLFKSL